MANPITIAGVVLTLNEEQDLPRALASLDWCDELVVLDSGSIDGTLAVSQTYQARFYTHVQKPPFLITSQRNWALENCDITSQWVLFLDADELIDLPLRNEIIRTISAPSPVNAIELAPKYLFLGKWLRFTQSFPVWHPRLVLRGQAYFTGGVWESFNTDAVVGRIYTPYIHYAFSKGLSDWVHRHLRYASWEAETVIRYLDGFDAQSFKTPRQLKLRQLSAHLWPLRPILRFTQKYFLNLGFLDGWRGFLYSTLSAFYELMIVIKIIELRRISRGLPL